MPIKGGIMNIATGNCFNYQRGLKPDDIVLYLGEKAVELSPDVEIFNAIISLEYNLDHTQVIRVFIEYLGKVEEPTEPQKQ